MEVSQNSAPALYKHACLFSGAGPAGTEVLATTVRRVFSSLGPGRALEAEFNAISAAGWFSRSGETMDGVGIWLAQSESKKGEAPNDTLDKMLSKDRPVGTPRPLSHVEGSTIACLVLPQSILVVIEEDHRAEKCGYCEAVACRRSLHGEDDHLRRYLCAPGPSGKACRALYLGSESWATGV